jgi:hypothetical protein
VGPGDKGEENPGACSPASREFSELEMANQFATYPLTCTTTMASSYRNTVAAGQQTNVLNLKKLQWSGGTAAQTCVIQDGHGNTLAQLLAVTGADTVLDLRLLVFDFQVTTLASGTLFIYA